jgi:hypothetical protein
MPQYEIIKDAYGEILKRTDEDGTIWWIPMNESNSDYQAYLNKDKAEDSTPMVTDEASTL